MASESGSAGHRDKRTKTTPYLLNPMDVPMQRKCDALMKNILKRNQAVHFSKPVEWKKMGLHDYPRLIKQPMDLSTVADQLTREKYARLEDFVNDVRLCWVHTHLCSPHSLGLVSRARRVISVICCSSSPPACAFARLRTAHLPACSLARLLTCPPAHLPACSLARLLTCPPAHLPPPPPLRARARPAEKRLHLQHA